MFQKGEIRFFTIVEAKPANVPYKYNFSSLFKEGLF
jgi:hypothetical protein